MASASPAALDDFIRRFVAQIDSGFGLISGDVAGVLATLVVISISVTAILWAIDETQNIFSSFVRRTLVVGLFSWVVASWHSLSSTIVNGFGQLGLKASGGGSVTGFFNAPTEAVDAGLKVATQLIQYIAQLASQNMGLGALQHIDAIICAAVAAIGILLAFIVLAIEIAVTIIEFHLVTLIGFVVVPFGVLTQTAFLAERAIGYVVSVGMKIMALGVILGIGINIFKSMTLSPEPTLTEECGFVLAALFLMMLALKVPSIAGALVSGGPQLSGGSALIGAAGVAAGVAGAGLAARTVGGAVASGWANGGAQVAAARAAATALPSDGSSSGPGPAGGASASAPSSNGSPWADFARAPVSTSVARARSWAGGLSSGGATAGAAQDAASTDQPFIPSPAETVARARARRGGGASGARAAFDAATREDGQGHGIASTSSSLTDSAEPKPSDET